MKTITSDTRSYLRFSPDPNTLTWLFLDAHDNKKSPLKSEERKGLVGLALNESHSGCSAVFIADPNIQLNQTYNLLVGNLPETKAKIVWLKVLDEDLIRVGFEYQAR